MGGLRAQGQRVNLRPEREDDLPVVDELRAADRGSDGELLVITPRGEDRPIGVLQYRKGEPSEGWATIDHVAVAEGARRWGLGQEAVRLFEEEAAISSGVRHFTTAVDARQGLALYLWLRLGYRPLDLTLDPWGHEALSMVRDAG